MKCLHCGEPIGLLPSGQVDPSAARSINGGPDWIHHECFLRVAVGSVGHQRKLCSCHGGTEEDPPGLTARQAAFEAWKFFHFGSADLDVPAKHAGPDAPGTWRDRPPLL